MGAASLALLTGVRLASNDSIGPPSPFLLYFGAVVAAAWYGGYTAGFLTTLAAAALGDYLFVHPTYEFTTSVGALAQTSLFVLEGVVLTVLTARFRAARTRSQETERDARTAADKLAAVLSGVGDGITMLDADGKLTYANEAGARLSGFASAAEMLRTPVADIVARFEMLREDGSPLPLSELPARRLMRGEVVPEMTLRFRVRATGVERWSVVRTNAVRDAQGRIRFVVNAFHEVTEERQHQRALQISQEWFATALRSIGDAVITTDREGRVTFLNPVAAALTGWTTAEAAGRPLPEVFAIFNESSKAAVESPVDRVLRDGRVVGLANHTVLRARDGRETPIDDSAAPIKTDTGELVGVVLVFRDVSAERKEEAKRAFLAQVVIELSSSLDYQTTLATVARLAVPAVADWCAVDMVEDGELQRLAVAHVDPAKVASVQELERRYPPDPNATTGARNILRTGQSELLAEIPAALLEASAQDAEHLRLIRALALRSYIGVPIKHGGKVVGVITLVMAESQRLYDAADLEFATALAERASIAIENANAYREAERLRAEAAAERDRLGAMIAAAPIAICVMRGPDLVFELMNEPYRARFGGLAKPGGKLTDLGPDSRNLDLVRQVFRTGQPAAMAEYPSTANFADGLRTHYVTFSLQPLSYVEGQVDSVVVFVHDVTDQVLARQRVDAARVQAELASRSKDEFLAMLGHELRNPLAPIVTALQLMNLRAGGALERERAIIDRQVKHVVRLVDDLLDVSRITRGRVDLAKELITISEVVAKALEVAGPLIEQRMHHVTTTIAPELFVHGDPVRLAQVLSNVINNAAKYTEKGGHITIRGWHDGDQAVVSVRDDGIGIAPEMLPRVFELFVQERQALDRSQGGLGLGLAIVRSLVTLHGGAVEARSEGIGSGTEVVIRLPAARGTQVAGPAPVVPRIHEAMSAERVLVVDDNADAQELMVTALEMLGYQATRASDGAEALVVAERERPTIGLLDIGLPVMNGYELARRLREIEGLTPLWLVAITGYGQPSDREATAAAGFDEHLVKPVTIEAVQAAIERAKKS